MLGAEFTLTLPRWIHDEVDVDRRYTDDEERVGLAIRLARRNAVERSGGPFGAALFDADGRLLSVGVNRVLPEHCSVAHAETTALMLGQARMKRARLNSDGARYVLASSAQPCAMCYGASIWAGIDELVIGARADDVMELSEFDEGPLPADWVGELEKRGIAVRSDVLRPAAREVFDLYASLGGARY